MGEASRRRLRHHERVTDPWAPEHVVDVDRLTQVVRGAPPAAPVPPVLVQGDLYARHLLVDDGARLAGVIDWGDVHIGERAVDLSVAHGFLPPRARAAFRQAYGPIDAPTWARAAARAVQHAALLACFALHVGDADLRREAALALTWEGPG
jgi:aminoglycoside phosphotransferase (APT) family kinase protein